MTSAVAARTRLVRPRVAARTSIFWLVVLAGTMAIPVISGGTVVLAHLVFGVAAVSMFFSVGRNNVIRNLWLLGGLWSAAQIVSNLLHEKAVITAPVLAGPTIIILATTLYWMHIRLKYSVVDILVAVCSGWILLEIAVGRVASTDNIWKYSIATPASMIVLAIAYKMHAKNWVVIALLLGLAGVSRYYDSRLQTGIFLLCALAIFFLSIRKNSDVRRRGGNLALFALLASALAVFLIYPAVADAGFAGQRAQTQQQAYDAEDANFLLATRMEFPQMAYLASQHLAAGIGSYEPIDRVEALEALQFLNDHVVTLTGNDRFYLLNDRYDRSGYRAHSAATASVLYAGILAAPFWLFLLFQNFRAIAWAMRGGGVVTSIVLYLCLLTSWDSLFSPLTSRSHLGFSVVLFLLAVVYKTNRMPDGEETEQGDLLPTHIPQVEASVR